MSISGLLFERSINAHGVVSSDDGVRTNRLFHNVPYVLNLTFRRTPELSSGGSFHLDPSVASSASDFSFASRRPDVATFRRFPESELGAGVGPGLRSFQESNSQVTPESAVLSAGDVSGVSLVSLGCPAMACLQAASSEKL